MDKRRDPSSEQITPQIVALQSALITCLVKLTAAGQAYWLRTSSDPNFVYCFVDDEEITFEVASAKKKFPNPDDTLHGVKLDVRNISLLWLEGTAQWDLLLGLLRSSRIEDDEYVDRKQRSIKKMFDHFEKRANTSS